MVFWFELPDKATSLVHLFWSCNTRILSVVLAGSTLRQSLFHSYKVYISEQMLSIVARFLQIANNLFVNTSLMLNSKVLLTYKR